MDAWCALWFWPVSGTDMPPTLDEWITTLEGLLGTEPKGDRASRRQGGDRLGMFGDIHSFTELRDADDTDRLLHAMAPLIRLQIEHPWIGTVRELADQEGFFHWDLDFAHIFVRGGFDLQLGNPPWVRPEWEDDTTLAESDPFFKLTQRIPEEEFNARRDAILQYTPALGSYLGYLSSWAGITNYLGSPIEYSSLAGMRTNLYMNFIERTWRSTSSTGTVGLLHPDGHLTDASSPLLRAQAYSRLRRHWAFRNQALLFEDIGNTRPFGISIYGAPQPIHFLQLTGAHVPETVDASLVHDGSGAPPGLKLPSGNWDRRPHRSRVITIDTETLAQWAKLFDPPGTPPQQARLVQPLTMENLDAVEVLARQSLRIEDLDYHWSSGWDEKGSKKAGFIYWNTSDPTSVDEVVLQGPHFSVATPFAKIPNVPCRSHRDYSDIDLEALGEVLIPRTNYQRASSLERYRANLSTWDGLPYTRYWRLAWRRMADAMTERTLMAALIPPGPTHIHTVQSLAMGSDRETALVAGLWASIPFDYLVKISGKADVQDELVRRFPAPIAHPLAPFLLLRALRLNCLTLDYAPLWEALFEDSFKTDNWTPRFGMLRPLQIADQRWQIASPLRTELERRAALVEIDALAAMMLGVTADQLCAMYRAQFGVLRVYEYTMFFDAHGRKIAKETHARGWRQQQGDYELAEQWSLENEDRNPEQVLPLPAQLRGRYRPPLTRPDREAEMRAAYEEFERRLAART